MQIIDAIMARNGARVWSFRNRKRIKFVASKIGRRGESGQLLIEVIIAVSVVVTLAGITSTLVVVAQRNQISARRQDAASALMSELYSIVGAISNSDSFTASSGFNKLYCPPNGACPSAEFPVTTGKGTAQHYRPILLGDHWELEQGDETVAVGDIDFTRYVTIENVCRDAGGSIVGTWTTSVAVDCPNGSSDDPSAQKLVVTLQTSRMNDLSAGLFATRWNNSISSQTEWSGGLADEPSLGETVVNFKISWLDAQPGESVRVLVCKTDEISGLNYTCPGGIWAETAGWTTSSTTDLYYTPQSIDVGTNNYFAFVCDDEGACSASDNGTFTMNQ